MQISGTPAKFPIPFANAAGGAYIRTIPQASQIGITNGAASLTDGFPPLTFLAVGAGGVPPFGQDFNGILNQITLWSQFQGAGGNPQFDGSFSTSIGGYPQGAILASTTPGSLWTSSADNNTNNPDSAPTNWLAIATSPVVQNNTWIYGQAAGSVNAYTLATSPAITSLVTGQEVLVFFGTPNTSTTPTLNRDSTGAKVIIKQNGAAVANNDVTGWISLIYDGTNYRSAQLLASDVLAPVTANVILYVRTDGNDANNGSANNAANAFLTIQAAYNYALQRLSFGGFTLTIQLGNTGTYSGPVTMAGAIVCRVQGDAANQAAYTIAGVPPSAIQGVMNLGTGGVALVGLRVQNTTTVSGFGSIVSCGGGTCTLQNVTLLSGTQVSGYGLSCGNGSISISAGCIFQCSCANSIILCEYGGLIGIGANMAVPVALSCGSFALAFGSGSIAWSIPGYVFTGAGVAGTIGQRYNCQLNGTINTGGGGANVFPGNSAGAVSTGGQYA